MQPANKTSKYANTVAVANDLLHYTELRAQNLGLPAEQSKLWYYGVSYGTVLGATFASLFPNRIGRMILDGVVDADDYYEGGWNMNLFDTDKAAKTFFTYCHQASPELCAFHGNASSPEQIERRFYKLFNDLREHPILISDPSVSFMPVLVGWQALKAVFLISMYDSIQKFPSLASILNDLEHGNGTSLAISSGRAFIEEPVNSTDEEYVSNYGRTQIACIDANGRFNMSTFEQYENHTDYLLNQSFYGGNTWAAMVGMPCRAFDIKPPESQVFSGRQKLLTG